MDRFTHRYMDGQAWVSIFDIKPFGEHEAVGEPVNRLAAYEDIGMTPAEIMLALRAQQEQTRNAPLTSEDLKEMDGQPVWAEEPDGYKHNSRWVLVSCAWKSKGLIYLYSWPGQVLLETFLLGGGKIFRRPPVGPPM